MRIGRLIKLARDAKEKPHRIPSFICRNSLNPIIRPLVEQEILNGALNTNQLSEYVKNDKKSKIWFYGEAETYQFEEPDCCPNVPKKLAIETGKINFDQPFVCSMHDSWLLGPEPIVATSTSEFLYESATGRKHMISRGAVQSICKGVNPFKDRKTPKEHDYERLCLLTGPLSDAYAHWFHDYLPRLEGLEHYMAVTGNKPPLLISPDPPSWMRDSLRYLGYGEEDIVEWNDSLAAVKELIIPSLRSNCLIDGPDEQKHLHRTGYEYRNKIIDSVVNSDDNTSSSDIIYINRKDAPTRQVLNRNELLAELDMFDIESVTMSHLPFSKQVAKVQGIKGIIAPHGAGLLNMLWADDIFIIELFGDHVTAGSMSLANNLGHEYHCVSADAEGKNIVVDTDHVKKK